MTKHTSLAWLGVSVALVAAQPVFAQQRGSIKSKTVGDVLKMIEREDRGRNLKMQGKSDTALPEAVRMQRRVVEQRNLMAVKPPRSSDFYRSDNENEAELERITDQQIDKLYRLTQQFRRSKNRGELWLRLAELYSEKARLIEFKKQHEYDRKLDEWNVKKAGPKPKLDLAASDDFNRKAVQLYEWFLKDFPNDEKVDQALFFLGYNYVQLNEVKKGVHYYTELTTRFPKSPYISESYFALGEYYFENEQWDKANEQYQQVIAKKSARLYDFALYKSAWCLYRMGRTPEGMKYLEAVIRRGRAQAENAQLEGRKEVNRLRLTSEARKDLVPFYAETRDCAKAEAYFLELAGSQADADKMLEGLAYSYSSSGHRDCTRYLFRVLIVKNPRAPKAFDYQYQVVQNYLNVENTKSFQEEMFRWIVSYGPNSGWAKANSENKELLETSYNLQESTLRNYVLQLHQTAQNARSTGAQKEASEGYVVYIQAFANSKQITDMHFFYGELLFDMKKWNEAAAQYAWVVEHDTKSPFYEKAVTNTVLAIDKTLPDEKAVREKLGTNTDPQPLDANVARFEAAAKRYFELFPKGSKAVEIKFRLGRLYYAYSHLDEALELFKSIVRDYPRTKYAEYSANLILDIYDLKKDYVGLTKAGNEILANPTLANSEVGQEVRNVVERASFKKGQDLEVAKNYADSAREYESFAKNNPKSNLALSAQYNSGINYERSGDLSSALRMYGAVLASSAVSKDKKQEAKNQELRLKTRKLMAGLSQQVGQYKEAAQQYERYAKENPSDKDVAAFYFNAAVIYDGYDMIESATRNYEEYFKHSRNADRKESNYYIAEMYRRRSNKRMALSYYEKYLSTAPSDAQKTLEANYQMGVLTEQTGNRDKAATWYNRTISVHKSLAAGNKNLKAGPAAESKLKLALRRLEELKAIRIPMDPSKQQAAVQQKLGLITKLNNEMADVIRYDHGPTIVGALAATGQAYDHMNQAISQAPLPRGLTADELKQYQAGIEQIVAPFRAKALENYRAAYSRSAQLEAYGEWSNVARRGLERYAPKEVVGASEKGMEAKVQDWMGL